MERNQLSHINKGPWTDLLQEMDLDNIIWNGVTPKEMFSYFIYKNM